MKNRDVIRFIKRFTLFILPFIFIISSFIIIDPFKIIFSYADYSGAFVTLNPDYISTTVYLKNREKYRYDSFIFGSSKTLSYKTNDWKKYLEDASPFVYHSSSESLYGIWLKLKFIDGHKDPIKNAVLIVDKPLLEVTTNNPSHLYIKHPEISQESYLTFYCNHFKAYFTKFFFVRVIDYSLFHQYRPYMEGYIDGSQTEYHPVTNDMYPTGAILARRKDEVKYYEGLKNNLYKRTGERKIYPETVIKDKQHQMLNEIKAIFEKQGTDFKIILGPNYDQVELNPGDLSVLENIFGKSHIYNFSGINDLTNDIHNYYDVSHYTMETGRSIFKEIYKTENN